MRSIILTTLFLIPLFGFASFPIQISIPSDTTIETKKETMEEYKIRIQKQLYKTTEKKYKNSIKENKIKFENKQFSNIKLKKYFKKRKNFVIGGGYNFYSKEKERTSLERLQKDELVNNPSINLGSILFDHFYIGIEIAKGGHSFLETRLYTPVINLYLSKKWGDNIEKYAIGYDYFITKNISVNAEGSYYSYSNSWSRTSIEFVEDSNAWFGFDIVTTRTSYQESLSGTKLSMKIQIHF